MCIAAWLWQSHPVYQFLLLLNRDEYHQRPTEPVGWWGVDGNEGILGGRDWVAGGTWLGCTKGGRLSFLTNFREPDTCPNVKSRGELPLRFLERTQNPIDFAEEIVKEVDQYNGFNLIVADLCLKSMVYISNRPKGKPVIAQIDSPGLHVLSNARLDTPWDKAQRLRKNLADFVKQHDGGELSLKEMAEALMQDATRADTDKLPDTGCDPEWEMKLSSIFIEVDTELGRYGTRSTSGLSVKQNEVNFYERYVEGGAWKEHAFRFHIENLK